jgi:hypothetical protein
VTDQDDRLAEAGDRVPDGGRVGDQVAVRVGEGDDLERSDQQSLDDAVPPRGLAEHQRDDLLIGHPGS